MSISPRLRNQVMMLDNFTCVYCGYRGDDVHVDHYIPKILGGPDVLQNLVAACPACNLKKGDYAPYESGMAAQYGRYKACPQRVSVHKKLRKSPTIQKRTKATDPISIEWMNGKTDLVVAPYLVPADEQRRILAAAQEATSRRQVSLKLYEQSGGQRYTWVQLVCDAAGLLPAKGSAQ
jgi:hypothetical protein